ncbi:GspH/FimT family pseudopilin [Aquabacterium sp.]|uniref:GspH/FimT family pseudopilin n=1 Tax=Aquabacterium sp. TaxID=1872578 RepID=UPI0037848107
MSKHSFVRPSVAVSHQRGVTLIETLCAASVLATAVGLAAPAMESWKLRQALHAEAAALETDIHLARSSAVAMNQIVRLDTQALGGSSCYIVHTGSAHACECSGQGLAHCTGDAQILRVSEQRRDGSVRLTTTKVSLAFDPQRGTVTPTATLKLADAQGRALHQIVNIMGRVRSCSPQPAALGVRAC